MMPSRTDVCMVRVCTVVSLESDHIREGSHTAVLCPPQQGGLGENDIGYEYGGKHDMIDSAQKKELKNYR